MRYKPIGSFLNSILPNWVAGICLAPFGIYIREEYINREKIRRHEAIHWKQQIELLILPFYLIYFVEWILKGYKGISFEREANHWEDKDITKRKPYGWMRLIYH